LPEGVAALRAARLNRLQTSLNLALGSALASIGLTIPTVAAVSLVIGQPIALGLGPKEIVLLLLTLLVSTITLGTGRSTVLQGVVHLVIFATFLFLSVVPGDGAVWVSQRSVERRKSFCNAASNAYN
jgi:Ca2+:H+ antiporter